MSFPCVQCGLCCQNLGSSALYRDLDRGDGVCRYYDVHKKGCSIYDERPFKCRIDKGYGAFSSFLTRREYNALNMNSCLLLAQRAKDWDAIGQMLRNISGHEIEDVLSE